MQAVVAAIACIMPSSPHAAGRITDTACTGVAVAQRAAHIGAAEALAGSRSDWNHMLRPIALAFLIGLSAAVSATTPATEPTPPAGETPAGGREITPAEPPSAVRVADAEGENVLDATRYYVHYGVEWVARGVDGWFGDKPFEEGGRVAGSIGLSFLWRQDEGFDALTRFRVRLNLPNVREKAYLFIGRDNERELVTDRPEGFTRREQLREETRDDQSFFAGIGRDLGDLVSLRAGFRGGLKPYAQARLQKLWELTRRNQFEFKETIFWTVDDGFGSTTAVFIDHMFDPSLVLRWQAAATWAQETEGVEWGSSIGLSKEFGLQRRLSLEALVSGATGGDAEVSEYGMRTRWEQPVYKDWLLSELILGYFWPRRDSITERGRTWAIGAGLQMRF